MRLASALKRTDVRFGLAASALLLLAVLFQFPATRLHARSRLESSPFKWTSDVEKRELEKQSYLLYMPKRSSLHFFSLGNDALAASYVWIKAAGYVTREFGTLGGDGGRLVPPEEGEEGAEAAERREGARRKFEWLSKLYNMVLDLDPHWVGACRVGAMILATVGEDPAGAVALLERGIAANPGSWLLPYEAGITMLMWPGHEKEAVRYFRAAARLSDDPERTEAIAQILPRLEAEAGRLDEAIRQARARALAFEGQAMGEASKRQLMEFLARRLELDLQEAVTNFRGREGRLPADVAELRRAGYLAKLDLHFCQAVVVYADRLRTLMEVFRRAFHGSAVPANHAGFARTGMLHQMVLWGWLEPPEWRDPFGRPFLYHAPTGTVRSEGLAELEAHKTLAILNSAANTFRMRHDRWPGSLEELAEYFHRMVAGGRQLPSHWAPVFEAGRPAEHPLAAWGYSYEYDRGTGKVAIRPARQPGPRRPDNVVDPTGPKRARPDPEEPRE